MPSFYARWQNCDKRLLASSYLSARPPVRPSVRPSVHMEPLGSHWTDFHKNGYLVIFRKSVDKIQVPLKSDNDIGHFT